MSDEFPVGGEGNSFHGHGGKREFSLPRQNEFQSLQSSTTSTVAETTGGGAGAAGAASGISGGAAGAGGAAAAGASAAGVSAGAITAGSVTAGIVVTGVVVLAPSINTLPTVKDLSTEVTSSTVSYAFTASYVSSGTLYVKLSDASGSSENSFDLTVEEEASSMENSLSASTSSSASSSAATYLLPIQGSFTSLKAGTNYTLTVSTNLTSSTQTTLSTISLQTSKETVMPSASFSTPTFDYDAASLSYTFTLADPSQILDATSLYSELVGYDSTKKMISRDTPFTGNPGEKVTLSLADFMKGNYLRLSLYGKLTSSAVNDEAISLGEIALYY